MLVVVVAFFIGAILIYRRRVGRSGDDVDRRRPSRAEANAYHKKISGGNYGGGGGAA
ncbi:MAG TPA: hypothetical protein VIP75_11150 [Acidothermales bacterium]